MRILLDTNLLVRAAISPRGSAREILRCIEGNENHALVVFGYLFSELVDVLRRDRIRARFPLTDGDIRSYCEHLAAVGDEVSPKALGSVIDDPKDQAIIDAAVVFSRRVRPQLIRKILDRSPHPGVVAACGSGRTDHRSVWSVVPRLTAG